jgi:cysteine-rich repeat protein
MVPPASQGTPCPRGINGGFERELRSLADGLVGDVPICGDGIPQNGEFCDDGNTTDGDGCSAVCGVEAP